MSDRVRLDRFLWARAKELDPSLGEAVRQLVKKFQSAHHPQRKGAYGEALEVLAEAFRGHRDHSSLLGWEQSAQEWERTKAERWPTPARVHLPGRQAHGRGFPGGTEMTQFLKDRLGEDPAVPDHTRSSLEKFIAYDWLPSIALKELVATYSEHPDYQEIWRP